MQKVLDLLFWTVARCLLALRYRVSVRGAEKLQSLTGPTLVIPNHPAYVDPMIVFAHVRLKQPLRPIVYADTYRFPLFYPVMRVIRAFEVPNLSRASRQSRQKAMDMLDATAAALNRGESFLLYPSGRLVRTGIEVVGSARAAAELLGRCPNANVVLVRITGLWGSMFGCARSGNPPPLTSTLLAAVGWLVASFIFFMPRRRVRLEIEVLDRSQLPSPQQVKQKPPKSETAIEQ